MKNTLYNFITVAAACLGLLSGAGCQKTYDLELPLAVDANEVSLPKAGGSTHVMVYSTGTWNLSFAEPVAWASVNKTSGQGNGDFLFTYRENTGLSRKATLLLERNGETRQIVMFQAAGETDPTLVLSDGNVQLVRDGLRVAVPLLTNLYDNLSEVKTEIVYADGDEGGWITDPVLTMENLSFDVADNATSDERIAVVRISVADANGEVYSTSATVSQSAAQASLAFKDIQPAYDVAPNGEVLDLALETNLSGYYPVRAIVTYDGASSDWLTQYKIDGSGLHLTVPGNKDAVRSADFALAYTRKDGSEVRTAPVSITQDKDAEKIAFTALRARVSSVETIDENLFIEGVVISDCTSKNMETNPNTDCKTVDVSVNDKTAYLQSTDGRYGFRLQFEKSEYNTMRRYDKVALSIRKATVTCEQNPLRYTISGLKATHIISAEAGTAADITAKQKSVPELTDEDLYTFVSLRDMEFVFKDGSYANVYEPYTQKSNLNAVAKPNLRGDGWASPLTDASGNTVFMMVNSLCEWRRTGNGVPKGVGTMSGILVHTALPRYGDNLGTYQIRPLDEQDIAIAWSETSAFRTLVEWNWNAASTYLKFETAGNTSGKANDRILADIGTGYFSTDTGATMGYGADYNALDIQASGASTVSDRGLFKNGGMCFTVAANKWWNWTADRGNSILVEFSTAGISGSALSFSFSFGAGSISAATSKDFPAYWQVEYSTDGTNFTRLGRKNIVLRSVPWWEAVSNVAPLTSCEAGLGYTEHHIQLPASLLGQQQVTLRLSPATKAITTLDPWNTIAGTLTSATATSTAIRFGCVSIKYKL